MYLEQLLNCNKNIRDWLLSMLQVNTYPLRFYTALHFYGSQDDLARLLPLFIRSKLEKTFFVCCKNAKLHFTQLLFSNCGRKPSLNDCSVWKIQHLTLL